MTDAPKSALNHPAAFSDIAPVEALSTHPPADTGADHIADTEKMVSGEAVAWLNVERAVVWNEYLITDGQHVAVAQLAEADYGGTHWATEHGLGWEPTLCTAWPPTAAPPAVARGDREAGLASDLRNLKAQFEQIAEKPADEQPHYPGGMRPFGTGDLRHFIEALDRAILALSAPPSVAGVVGTGTFLLDRLTDFENRIVSEDDAREFHGHVAPAIANFRSALAIPPHPQPDERLAKAIEALERIEVCSYADSEEESIAREALRSLKDGEG